jgi:phospholipid/cholesterol/gamma-HCH transport system ATP-binding protein
VGLIKRVNDALGVASIVVSHDVAETLSIADYVYLVSEGEVVPQGTPEELEQTRSQWARQFLSGAPDGPVPFHFPAPDYAAELLRGRDDA